MDEVKDKETAGKSCRHKMCHEVKCHMTESPEYFHSEPSRGKVSDG